MTTLQDMAANMSSIQSSRSKSEPVTEAVQQVGSKRRKEIKPISVGDWRRWVNLDRLTTKSALRSPTSADIFSTPEVSFSTQLYWVEHDADLRLGLGFLRDAVVGPGIYFTADDADVLKQVNHYSKSIELYQKLYHGIVPETMNYGNSVWWKKTENLADLVWMPISDLKRIWWSVKTGEADKYEFRGDMVANLEASEILHFAWGKTNSEPFGKGLITPLVSPRTYKVKVSGEWENREMPSIMDVKTQMLDETRKIMRRYIPRNLYTFPGATKSDIDSNKSTLKVLEPEEDFVVQNGTVQELGRGGGRVTDIDTYHDVYGAEILKAMGTPVSRLFTEPGFTEASAKAALEAADLMYKAYQHLKADEVINVLIKPWYNAKSNMPLWDDANIEMHFGLPDSPEIDSAFLINAATAGLIRVDEFRRNIEKSGVEIWEPESEMEKVFAEMATLNYKGGDYTVVTQEGNEYKINNGIVAPK